MSKIEFPATSVEEHDQLFGVKRVSLFLLNNGALIRAAGDSNGNIVTTEYTPTTVLNGKTAVTTAGTRVTLASSTPVKSVTIKALSINTGFIYVGNATVSSSNGFQLSAGDTVSLDIADLNTVNIDSSVNGEGVSYLAIN